MSNYRLTACLVPDCPGKNWTDGRREPCPACCAREKRIRKMSVRLHRGSHPALGRIRECKVAEVR